MEYEALRKMLAEWGVAVVPRGEARVRGFDLDTFRGLARQTESVDYDCSFRDGCCRDRGPGDKNCCSECARTFGYWRREEGALDEEALKVMAPAYNERTGFLGEGAGCLLPRELRSPICLYVLCSDAKLSGGDVYLLNKLHYGLYWT